MNLTVALDPKLLERARARASARGISLSQLVRELLEAETAQIDPERSIAVLDELWSTAPGDSGGARIHRDHAYGRPR